MPRPEPLPVAAPVRRGVRWGVVAAVLGALVLCGACAGVSFVVLRASVPLVSGERRAPVSGAVVFGSGRYLAVECQTASGMSVYVVDLESGEQKAAVRHRLLAAEPHAPVLWLTYDVEQEGSVTATSSPADRPALLTWVVDSDAAPRPAGAGEWRPWPGDGGYAALLGVETSRGAWPARLGLERLDGVGGRVEVALPDGLASFEPIGWSASGRYFAVRDYVDLDDPLPEDRTVVIDASDGSVSAVITPRLASVGAAWDTNGDELHVVSTSYEGSDTEGGQVVQVTSIAPGRPATEEAPATIPVSPEQWSIDGWKVYADVDGLLLSAPDLGLWRVSDGTAELVADATAVGAWCVAVLPEGDTLWHEPSPVSDRIVRVSRDDSDMRAVVWTEEDTRKWRWPPQ